MQITSPGTTSLGRIYSWLVIKNNKVVFNVGSPTRTKRSEHGAVESVPSLTFVDVASDSLFSWEMIDELRSDHLPFLINGGLDTKVERDYRASGNNSINPY